MATDQIDQRDLKLIGLLQGNPRISVVEAATRLEESLPTVRKRVKRLIEADYIRFLCLVNPTKTGYSQDCVVHVRIEIGKVDSVAENIGQMEEVTYVGVVLGPHDLLVVASFSSSEEMRKFLSEKIPLVDGVVRTDSSYVLSVVKRSYARQPQLSVSP